MHTAEGQTIHGGIAIGPLRIYRREELRIPRFSSLTPREEWERFAAACGEAKEQLDRLREKTAATAGEEAAAIFEIHRMMLEDEDYLEAVKRVLDTQGAAAGYAAAAAGEELAAVLSAVEDSYMQARAEDIRDVSLRVAGILNGGGETPAPEGPPAILAAGELTPGEMAGLDRSRLLGIVTRRGSLSGHTAILARAMNLPALTGVDFDCAWEGRPAILDGGGQRLHIDPDAGFLAAMEARQKELREQAVLLQALREQPSVTLDGREIRLCANIGGAEDAEKAVQNGAQGIGLFRSEFLYLNAREFPGEERQFALYKQAVKAMGGRRVVIRTLDIGADKQAPCFHLEKEENPALGYRGIRICLTRQDIFRQQLRAILRASAFGRTAVLFPMIISLQEVREAKKILEECRAELQARGTALGDVETGVMVETPAAVVLAEELAGEVDFFSLGTNDLTQYTLAIDRQNPRLEPFRDPCHTAVMRMIRHTVEAGHRSGCRVSICGELAADHTLTETFLRMGVDELSVPPWEILPLRKLIRALDLSRPPVSSDSGGRGQFPAWGAAPELRDPAQKAIRSR